MIHFVWHKQAIWIQCYPFYFSWNHCQCRKLKRLCSAAGQRGGVWAHFCPRVVQGVFAVSSMLVLFMNLRSQLYHDCIHTFKWGKENKNVCHAFKKFQRKGKSTNFQCTSIQEHHQGKDNTPYCLSGQRNCDFCFKTAELSSSFNRCVHHISLDHMSPHFPMTDWCSSLGAIWRSEKLLSEFDMRARGSKERGNHRRVWDKFPSSLIALR